MLVAVVENTANTRLGQVGVALNEASARTELFQPWRDARLPDPSTYDALVVLGGEQNAIDDQRHPYLAELSQLMRTFGSLDKAVLGICLGSQLLARGYGARNILGSAREFGWHRIEHNEYGAADPVLGCLDSGFPIFQWHTDTFTLPEDARLLAASRTVAHQAFRIGRATYGMQFHFEADRAVVEEWVQTFPDLIERHEPGWLQRYATEAVDIGAAADAAGLAIARAWVALI